MRIADNKHNILLIEVDQWNADCLSRVGHPNVRTPRLDALAREGIHFSRAACNSPLCLPSRISMLSGLYPASTGQFGNPGDCDRRIRWLPNTLAAAGYRTAAFGKFHVAAIGPERWGFEVAAASLPEDEPFARPPGNTYRAYCAHRQIPWPTDQIHGSNPLGAPPPEPPGVTPALVGERRRACPSAVRDGDSLEHWTTQSCLDYLDDSVRHAAPFFIWLTYDRPHFPTALPREWMNRVDPAAVRLRRLPNAEERQALPPSARDEMDGTNSIARMGEEQFRYVLATYFALIEYLDSQIGRVLDRLQSLGEDAHTTIFFLADHGDEAGRQGLINKTLQVASEALTRVPLIAKMAPQLKGPRGITVAAPVELVDLYPTVCALAGVPAPEALEGRDLSPVLKGDATPDADRPVFSEKYFRKMVTHQDWKLVFDPRNDAECQLYDLGRDPDGYRNLYAGPELAPRRLALKQQLLTFLVARQRGPVTPDDIVQLERALDPGDPAIPPPGCPRATADGVAIVLLAGATLVGTASHGLLAPSYDAPLLLFDRGKGSGKLTRDRAVPCDPRLAEPILDQALHTLISRTPANSLPAWGDSQYQTTARRRRIAVWRSGLEHGATP